MTATCSLQADQVTRILDAFVELREDVSAEDRITNKPRAALLEGDKVSIVTPAPGYDIINNQKSRLQGHRNGPPMQKCQIRG